MLNALSFYLVEIFGIPGFSVNIAHRLIIVSKQAAPEVLSSLRSIEGVGSWGETINWIQSSDVIASAEVELEYEAGRNTLTIVVDGRIKCMTV